MRIALFAAIGAVGAIALLLISARAVQSLPQFAVQSARACDTCHVEPTGWENPELSKRKCTLNCNSCHVNPTGGGLRNQAGLFYGHHTLPLYTYLDSPKEWMAKEEKRKAEEAGSQPESRPAGEMYPNVYDDEMRKKTWGSKRYAGAETWPGPAIGGDLRVMAYWDYNDEESDNLELSVFPMQADLYVAARPYNPEGANKGRVTVLMNTGFQGNRDEEFDNVIDRYFLREWYTLVDDLPYQFYGKAGRFMPAFGWRLDDHTAFIRQEQGLDQDKQVTGIELGLNPNYFFLHTSVYAASRDWTEPMDPDGGMGTALYFGWRDLPWQLSGQLMYEDRDDANELWAGVSWALNFHDQRLFGLPMTYLGELDVNNVEQGGDSRLGLTHYHELDVRLTKGFNIQARYDWRDPDVELKDDAMSRATLGFRTWVYANTEIIINSRFTLEERPGDDQFIYDGFFQLHAWF